MESVSETNGILRSKLLARLTVLSSQDRLVGVVVRASVSRAEDPGFDSRLRRGDFSWSSHTSELQMSTPMAILTGAWRERVSAGTGWPGVSILWLKEKVGSATSISVWQHAQLFEQTRPPRCTSLLLGR